MSDPLKAFMQANALTSPAFEPGSRYHGLDTKQWTRPDGEATTYVKRRFVPPAENYSAVQLHYVAEGDRVDNLSAKYLSDPQQYWRLCDGNGVLRPNDLTRTVGDTIKITMPEGIPGGPEI